LPLIPALFNLASFRDFRIIWVFTYLSIRDELSFASFDKYIINTKGPSVNFFFPILSYHLFASSYSFLSIFAYSSVGTRCGREDALIMSPS
jgi:hypothetical protein